MRTFLKNTLRLGVKELWSLWHDRMMLVLICYIFTFSVYTAGTVEPNTLRHAPIAIVDEDNSTLSNRISSTFYAPEFTGPSKITLNQQDPGLDAGTYTFVLDIPPDFQRDVLAGRSPTIQLNVDATRMSQAFTGSGYINQMVTDEVINFIKRRKDQTAPPGSLAVRVRFNPTLERAWFRSLMELVNNLTMLSIVLTGAALIREKEHGTVEHLLVMPVSPAEIMLSKTWAMSLVVLLSTWFSITLVVRWVLHVHMEGSIGLFLAGTALHLFATSCMGIFMATLARSMPQFGMLIVLVLMPLQWLSGGSTPFESMPLAVRVIMSLSPTTHFVEISQAILFRGANFEVIWPQFLWLLLTGIALFAISHFRFRRTIGGMA